VTVTPNFPFSKSALSKESEAAETDASQRLKCLIAKTDANALQALDPVTLNPIPVIEDHSRYSYGDINPEFTGALSAAHHQYDPSTGDVYNVLVDPKGPNTAYQIMHSNAKQQARLLTVIRYPKACYIHSMALSKKYLILILQPWYMGWMGLKPFFSQSFLDGLEWDGKSRAQFYVIDRTTGEVKPPYAAEKPLFFFHTMNSWDNDDNNEICIELVGSDSPSIAYKLLTENLCKGNDELKSGVQSTPEMLPEDLAEGRRYTISLNADKPQPIQYEAVTVKGIELPRFNSSKAGRKTKYVYGILNSNLGLNLETGGTSNLFQAIAKFDTASKTNIIWEAKDEYPGEPIFIPDPTVSSDGDAAQEDNGVVLSVVLDGNTRQSYLLVLDAKTFQPMAKAKLPCHVPFGFHGSFIGNQQSMDSFN
jgi:torulene dioxygenase